MFSARCFALGLLVASQLSCAAREPTPTPVAPPTSSVQETMKRPDTDPPPPAEHPTLHLALDEPQTLSDANATTVTLKSYIVESIEADPEDPSSYPAGAGVTMTIEIGAYEAHLSELSDGYESTATAWTPAHRVSLKSHDSSSASVVVEISRITDQIERVLHESYRVERGRDIELDAPLRATFVGHGHKMVHPGQTSPLMIAMRYRTDEQEMASESYNLFPPDERTWTWRDYQFSLVSHEYDRFMVVRVERLALEPQAAAKSQQPE